jgi:beta-lactamase superfamily II metal-dependent hydrolase
MAFTIDFLPVDHGEMSGDAVVIRYTNTNAITTIVVDGGTRASGEAVIEHLRQHTRTRHPVVDHVVCTHPDRDHASGLRPILEQLPVLNLWMHRPWANGPDTLALFQDGRITDGSLIRRLRDEYPILDELEALAMVQRTTIWQPIQGARIGAFTVLAPSPWLYSICMANFDRTPAPKPHVAVPTLFQRAADAVRRKLENWDFETLQDPKPEDFRPENESSIVLWGCLDGSNILLTGDAGVYSLAVAHQFARSRQIDLGSAHLVQIAHHGSRSSIGPTVLDLLYGPRRPRGTEPFRTAFVSASKDSTTHPRRSVTNAYQRRGFRVGRTNGTYITFYSGALDGRTWGPLECLPFYTEVEE